MIFSSLEYLIFLGFVLAFLAIVPSQKIKKIFLLLASYFFYSYWDYRFLLLLILITIVNYWFGLQIEKNSDRQRRLWMAVSVSFNLIMLGVFKYFNFFLDTANALFKSAGVNFGVINIILPIGISFIIFEVISYTVDIYRRENRAGSFFELAFLVTFFPHLIAGPILKPTNFLPQLQQNIAIERANLIDGGQLFIVGWVKKVLVADRLSLVVDPVFASPEAYNSLTIWLAVFAYALQIYGDFSGYSDMAIGSAKMMGFEIPNNFDFPYISRSVTEFWRRWHISLSNWLRDYLYIPLGGNRKGSLRTYFNLIVVMLLGGLWHGASWNFVVWGGLHGIGLSIHRIWSQRNKKANLDKQPSWLMSLISWWVTLIFVCTLWVFFRSPNFATSWIVIEKMYGFTDLSGVTWIATGFLLALPICLIAEWGTLRLRLGKKLNLNRFFDLFVLFFISLSLFLLAPENPAPFIYFQF
jgi:alginate O-acetyltransferase complex protein AlgI